MEQRRDELNRYLIIFALTAPAAAAVWFVFHGVFATLSQTEAAMGYVDPTTRMGVDLGYVAMAGGSAIFGVIAVWAAFRAALAWLRARGHT